MPEFESIRSNHTMFDYVCARVDGFQNCCHRLPLCGSRRAPHARVQVV